MPGAPVRTQAGCRRGAEYGERRFAQGSASGVYRRRIVRHPRAEPGGHEV